MSLATFISLAFFIISFVITQIFFRKQLFNPLFVFFGIWLLALGLFEFNAKLNLFAVSISDKSILLMTLGFTAFFLGGVTVSLAFRDTPDATVKTDIALPNRDIGNLYKITAFALLMLILGVFWRFSDVIAVFGNPFSNLGAVRQTGHSGAFELATPARILTLFGYLAAINVGVLIVLKKSRLNFLLVIAILVLFYLNDITLGARGSTVNAAILLISAFLITKTVSPGGLKMTNLAQGVAIFAIGLGLITSILVLRSDREISYQERLKTDNYIYLVGTLPATSSFFDDPWPSTLPGQWTFAGLYQAADLVVKNGIDVPIIQPGTYQSSYAPILYFGPFNSSTFFTYLYSDFRETGLMFLSFMLGLISVFTFLIALNKKRLIDIHCAALMMFVIVFTIRGIPTNGIMFWTTLALVIAQFHILRAAYIPRNQPNRIKSFNYGKTL